MLLFLAYLVRLDDCFPFYERKTMLAERIVHAMDGQVLGWCEGGSALSGKTSDKKANIRGELHDRDDEVIDMGGRSKDFSGGSGVHFSRGSRLGLLW